jgi:hypothetical protein
MGMGLGPFDMVTYDYGLPLDGDSDAFGVNFGDLSNGITSLGGFDFADQVQGLGMNVTCVSFSSLYEGFCC